MANQLKRYRVALNERLEILTTLDNEIVELVDEKDIEQEITDSAVFRESIHKVLLDIEEKLSSNVDTSSDKSLNSSSINLGEGSQSNDSEIKAKLPKINLLPFSGDPINFQPFFDSFKSAIDDKKIIQYRQDELSSQLA